MYILMVRLKVKQDHIDPFIKASIADGSSSLRDEPGCLRFDIIQDEADPTLLAFNEVYSDEAAFEHHKTTPHFAQWDAAVKNMLDANFEVSFCRPVFPLGDARWDARRPGAVEDPAFGGSLYVIHAPLPIQPDKVDAFIEAVRLDGLGSTHEEPGCLRFDVYQNTHKPDQLYLYEVYVNKAAFEYHTRTPHIAKWRETVKDWYAGERTGGRRGRNVWPPDNWGWSSGKPLRYAVQVPSCAPSHGGAHPRCGRLRGEVVGGEPCLFPSIGLFVSRCGGLGSSGLCSSATRPHPSPLPTGEGERSGAGSSVRVAPHRA